MLQQIKKNYKIYLLAFILTLFFFMPFILKNDGIMIFQGDSYEQIYKYYVGGWTNFHQGTLGQFNWAEGLGNNIFAYVFYFLTSPWFLISLFLPKEWIPYEFLVFDILQFTLVFIFSHIWLSKLTQNRKSQTIGALILTFCGWMVFYLQYDHFIKAFIFYPMILYFTEEYLQNKKFIALTISIGLLGLTQYFLLYQFIPFLFLYTLVRYLNIHKEQLTFKGTLFAALKYAGLTFLGIGLSAVILVPCAYLVLSTPRFTSNAITLTGHLDLKQLYEVVSNLFTPVFSILDASYFINASQHDFIGWAGGTSIYCLSITPLLLPLTIKIKDKFKRNSYIGFLMALFFFLFFQFFSYLFQATIDTRWLYMFVFLFVMIDVAVLDEIFAGHISSKQLLISTLLAGGTLVLFCIFTYLKQLNSYENMKMLFASSAVILTLMLLNGFFLQKRNTRAALYLISCEVIYSGCLFYNFNKPISSTIFNQNVLKNEAAVYLHEIDDSFYRVQYDVSFYQDETMEDAFYMTSANEPWANGYNGFGFYCSIYNTHQEEFLNRFKSTWLMPQLQGRHEIYNLLSSKYWITYQHNYEIPYGFELLYRDETAGYEIYKNKNYVELGFTYDKTISTETLLSQSYLIQDQIMQQYLATETSTNTVFEEAELTLLTIFPDNEYRVYEFEEPISNTQLYIEHFGIPTLKVRTYYQGELVHDYLDFWQFNYIDLFIDEPIDKIEIIGKDEYGYGTQVYLYSKPLDDPISYEQQFTELTKNHFENVVAKGDTIEADITIENDRQMVFTSIPYDKGWTVYDNGQKIEFEKVQLGFVGLKLTPGEHHITFRYKTPWLLLGCGISGISVLILVGLTRLQKKKIVI